MHLLRSRVVLTDVVGFGSLGDLVTAALSAATMFTDRVSSRRGRLADYLSLQGTWRQPQLYKLVKHSAWANICELSSQTYGCVRKHTPPQAHSEKPHEMALEWVSGADFVCVLHHFLR